MKEKIQADSTEFTYQSLVYGEAACVQKKKKKVLWV